MTWLHELLIHSAQRAPDKTAVVAGNQRVSYRELLARACQLARALGRRGVGRGARVMTFADNSIDAAVAFWGILAANAVAVPINPSTKADKLLWLLDHCGASALITRRRLAGVFVPAVLRAARPPIVLVSEGTDGIELPGALDFASALAAEGTESPAPLDDDGTELAALIYTSGSTGRPKGVMLTHRNMLSAAESISQYLMLRHDDVVHGIMPLSFDYGLYQLLLCVREGARLVLAPAFFLPGQVLKQAAVEGVTVFPGVPTVFAMLEELRDLSGWDLSAVRVVTSTAAALTERHLATIRRVFPGARIFSMYGVTECKRCTYLPPEDLERKPGSVGIAIPGTELWLVDEQGRRLGAHQVGQIVIRGATVMRGYWQNEEETSRKLFPGPTPGERVLHTGDLGYLDDEGYLFFVGRMDDIIKSRGEKVAPKEVELVLVAIPGVREAAVVGVPDPHLGEAVKAFVVAAPGAALRESELIGACREKLESFMVPRSIALVSALPKNANGKIDKLALRGSSWVSAPQAGSDEGDPCAPS